MDTRQRQHFKELQQIYQRRLEILQKQAAGFGLYVPPYILIEIEDIKQKLADIDLQFSDRKSTGQQSSPKIIYQENISDAHPHFKSKSHAVLHEKLTEYFNDEDIRTLCFSLGIDYENLPSFGKVNKVRELIMYCVRNDYLEQLKEKCKELRPKVAWD